MSGDLARYVDGLVEGRRGRLVQRQKDRSVWRVEEDGRDWFAKRGVTAKRRREIARETENARALEAAGRGAPVLAAGRHASAQWLVTANAGRSFETEIWRGEWKRDGLLRDLAALVRWLHDRGWTFPDLTEEHVRVGEGELRLIDVARLRRGPRAASIPARAADLAAFLFSMTPSSMGDWGLTRAERVRLLRESSGLAGAELRKLCRLVDARIDALASRTRWRHGVFKLPDDEFGSAVRCDETPPFERLMSGADSTLVRRLPDRENRTLGRGPDGRPLFFVKVFPPTAKGWSPAMREVAAIDRFQRAGLLVNRLAAYAEDVDKGSLVAVRAAAGEPLDDCLRRGVSAAERRALAVQTARIWRRMRECGLRHRDAYPCHLFAARTATPPRFELRLIDMTRAGEAPFPRERWFVKDAAALWHGLPRPPVTRTDAVRWLREYFRVPRLDARAKRFARRVAAKERRIAARQARKARG